MHRIWPRDEATALDEAALERLYRYPDDRPWLVVNFVASADGAITVDNTSRPLSTEPDRVVFRLGSDLADVLLIGAGTAVNEKFHGYRPDDLAVRRRAELGLAPVPPTAVVSTGRSLPPDAPVLTDVQTPTLVLTCAAAPEQVRSAWADAGAEVLVFGDRTVDLAAARAALVERGLTRIDCEGGPWLFGALLAADAVDELRLTLSPYLVAGHAPRAALGGGIDPAALRLASVVAEADTLLMRYLVRATKGDRCRS